LVSYLSELREKKQIADLIRKTGYSLEEMQHYSIEAFTSTSRDKAFKVNENYEEFKELISELKKHITSDKEIVINDKYSIAMINSISCLDKIAKCWIDITDLAKPTYMLK